MEKEEQMGKGVKRCKNVKKMKMKSARKNDEEDKG